jgi:hypothetical protein
LDRHGRNIVQIAKGILRRRANHKAVVDAPSEEQPRKLPRIHRISRNDLYDLIWAEPMSKLAERFGISDVGLAKVCRRSDIPAPTRGYWAKIAAGGAFHRPELPVQVNRQFNTIRFRINRSQLRHPRNIAQATHLNI